MSLISNYLPADSCFKMMTALIGGKRAPRRTRSSRLAMSLRRGGGLAGSIFFTAILCLAHGSAFAATAYESAVLALRPVGFWLLNETNGTTAFDASGNGNNGAYQSMVRLGVPGVPNLPFTGFASNSQAASFNGGTNSWVTLTNLPVNSANLTITAWVYPVDNSSLGTILWNNSQNSGLGDYYGEPSELGYDWNGDGNTWSYQSGLFPPVNQWSFVAMVITPTNAVFYLGSEYGILSSATNNEPNAAANFTTGSVIGSVGSASPSTSVNGSMSDVAIFNFSFTPSQITQLYVHSNTNNNSGVPPVVTGLRATAGNAQVALSWNITSWGTSYNVKRSTASGSEVTFTNISVANYTDTGLTNGTTYFYVVSATNSAGEGVNSSEVSAAPLDGAPVAYDIVYVGDSITYGATLPNPTTQASAVQSMHSFNQRFNVDVSVSNQGHPGHTTTDWLPSTNPSSDFQLAIGAALALESSHPGQLIFSIMLGANDSGQSFSGTSYRQNLQSTIGQFLTNFPNAYIFVHYPTWYSSNAENNHLALEINYFPQIDLLISNCATLYPGRVFAGDKGQAFNYFSTNYLNALTPEVGSGPSFLHPNILGSVALGQFWAKAIASTLSFPAPLASPWMTSDIGSVGVTGSAIYTNGAFMVTGGGSGVWNEPTAFRYVYQTLTNSGCSIVAEVANFNVASGPAPAGVMISETLTGAGKHALVCTSKSSGTTFICATNRTSSFIPLGGSGNGNVPYRVKLARTNDIFYAYTSADGMNWTATGTQAMTMSNVFYIGLVVSSSDNSTTGTATFSNVTVLGMAAAAPAVPADVTATARDAQITLAWRASSGATSYNIKRSTASGSEVIFTNISAASYTDMRLTNGTTYYYVISATNSAGGSAISDEVSATPSSGGVIANGIYYIVCQASGLALDDPGGGGSGTGIDQQASGGVNQQWAVTSLGGGQYVITAVANGLALSGPTSSAQLVLQNYTGANYQTWTITPNGSYSIYVVGNAGSGQVMDDSNGSASAGNSIGQKSGNEGNNQNWIFTPVPSPASALPSIVLQPQPATAFQGQNLQFVVGAAGTAPLSYQWLKNDANLSSSQSISGTQTSTLRFNSVSSTDAGNYTVIISNQFGTVTSSVAPATIVVTTNYNAGILQLNPVGFWPLNETNGTVAFDISGHNNNGAYKSGAILGKSGVPNPPFAGFAGGSLAAGFNSSANNSWVTLTNLPVNSSNVTITEWIYPTNASALGTTFWNLGQNAGLSRAYYNNAALGYNWHGGDGNQWNYSAFTPPVNQWSFVALVITPTNAVFYMGNTNGLSSMINNDGNSAVNFTTGTSIGGDGTNDGTGFNGSLCDVTVFNYSLSSSQLEKLYSDAVVGDSMSGNLPASNPINILFSVKGNVVTLCWPEDHQGWIVQSNSVGLSDRNSWFDISNTQSGTNLIFSPDSQVTNVFYRLRHP